MKAPRIIAAPKRGNAGKGWPGACHSVPGGPHRATVRLCNAICSSDLEAALGQLLSCVWAAGAARLAEGVSQPENLVQKVIEGLSFSRLAVID